MSFLHYLDEEYFKQQDFLGVVAESLPKINPNNIRNDEQLVQALVDQNKAYGKKIITLIETVDLFYKTNALSTDRNQGPDFTQKLHKKIHDYEDQIGRLRKQNDEFSNQVATLSRQLENLQSKYTSNYHSIKHQSIIPMSNTPSPIKRNTIANSYDAYLDLENIFQSGEYQKGIQILYDNDYKKPPNAEFDQFSNWLAIANRIKDSQITEILNKLKIFMSLSCKAEDDKALDDSLEVGPHWPTIEKIYHLIDERLPKLFFQKEQQITRSASRKGSPHYGLVSTASTAKFNDFQSVHSAPDEAQFDNEQLKMKIRYLNNNLKTMEKEIQDKNIEIEVLKDRLNTLKSEKLTSPERVLKDNETLLQSIEAEIKARCEAEARCKNLEHELEEYKGKISRLHNDIEFYERRCKELTNKLTENANLINKLALESANFKGTDFHGRIEDILELLQKKDDKIQRLNEELSFVKEYSKSPERSSPNPSQIRRAEMSGDGIRTSAREIKQGVLIENALQIQANTLYNLKQTVVDLKTTLATQLNKLSINLPERQRHTKHESYDELVPTNETQRFVKTNNQTLREITNDIEFIRTSCNALVSHLGDPLSKQFAQEHTNLLSRLAQAEEKLFENISNALHHLSQVTSLVQELPSNVSGPTIVSQLLNQLQTLHTSLTRAIQEYPEFAQQDYTSGKRETGRLSDNSRNVSFFKDRLIRDQTDIQEKLKNAVLLLEKKHASETMSQLEKEIERNQELQEKIEAKNLIIHRLHLIFNEGIERANSSLDQLIKLADSTDAHRLVSYVVNEINMMRNKFKETIGMNKDTTLELKSVLRTLGHEIDNQKDNWERTLRGLKDVSENKADQLLREIDIERDAHRRELSNLNQIIEEKDRQLYQKDERYEELLARFKSVEKDCLDLVGQVERFKEKIAQDERIRNELEFNLNKLKDENHSLVQQLNELSQTRIQDIEFLESQIDHFKNENTELRDIKDRTENALRRTNENIDRMKLEYFSEINALKEHNAHLVSRNQHLTSEVEKKNAEISKLNQMLDSLQNFSNRQLETIKIKDEKLGEMVDKKREYELILQDLERQLQEANLKNQKNLDLLSTNSYETSRLREEVTRLTEKNDELLRELEELKRVNHELRVQNTNLIGSTQNLTEDRTFMEDRMNKMNEILNITKNEVKNCREIIEKKNRELELRQREIEELKALNLRRERETVQESELVQHLKKELKARNEELAENRLDHQRTLEAIEKLNIEIESLRSANRIGEHHSRELEKLNQLNRNLISELESLKKAMKNKEEQFSLEKEAYERELQHMQKRLNDVNSIIEAKDHRRAGSRTFNPYESFKSDDSKGSISSGYYQNLLESKDSEIRRLTQIVKNLTDNLRDTQENKFHMKKSSMI